VRFEVMAGINGPKKKKNGGTAGGGHLFEAPERFHAIGARSPKGVLAG